MLCLVLKVCPASRTQALRRRRDSRIHDRLVKASPLIHQTHFNFVDVSYSGSVNFLLRKAYIPESRCYNRLGSDPVNSATTMLEKRSQAPFAPGKRQCLMLDALVHHPVERQNPTLRFSEYVWQ